MSNAPVYRTSDISGPVLKSSTSYRVSPQLNRKSIEPADVPSSALSHQQPHHQSPETNISALKPFNSFQRQEDDGLKRIQTKYASPENVLPVLPATNHRSPIGSEDSLDNLPANMATQVLISGPIVNLGMPPPPPVDVTSGGVGDFPAADSAVVTRRKNRINDSVSAFSDTSSDISDATTSAPSAASSGSAARTSRTLPIPVLEGINDEDIQQMDMFYRSHKTDIRVCSSLVNMYVSTPKTLDRMPAGNVTNSGSGDGKSPNSPDPSEVSMEDWEFVKTGIPVLVLNTGEHVRNRKLTLVLAERGTGFTLWEDVLNHLTSYSTPHPNFHTLSLSTDSSRLVGFSFDEGGAADEFAEAVRTLLANPDDELLNLSKKKKKKAPKKEKKPKYKPPRKIDISQPCCFVHVTKLERPTLVGLSPYTFPPPPCGTDLAQVASFARSKSESSELSECSTAPSEH